ncbi:MAG: hypothetical protein WCD69_30035 [Xanthobacteraceae bacterium]|jgi:hypothetical protein
MRAKNDLIKVFGKAFLLLRLEIQAALSSQGGVMAKRKKKRRAWTSSELRELKAMARKKAKASQIAKKLKRTEGATRQKAFSIGLSLDSRS